ncbi:MAG: RNase H1/viroplasmin domain-containing protein, partial [Lachnospiraceae bacterium]|nr:RNase H1/viroplasmin domain-containing protein [Lachnospiraceae bacterium]
MGKKFYAIKAGVKPGIYTDWGEASAQVKGFKGAIYKGFETRAEAEAFMEGEVVAKTNTLPGKVNAANSI